MGSGGIAGGGMDNLYRSVIRVSAIALGLILAVWSAYVSAETIPATQQTSATVHAACTTNTFDSSCRTSSTPSGACNAWKSQFPAWSGYTFQNVASGQCWWNNATLGMTNYSLGGKYMYPAYQCGSAAPTGSPSSCGYTCPSGQGWTLDGQTCTRPDCPAGQTRGDDGICRTSCAAAGQSTSASGTWVEGTGGLPSSLCVGGCGYGAPACVGFGGAEYACQVGKSTGLACSTSATGSNGTPTENAPSQTDINNATKTDCVKSGQGYGEVNGVAVCTGPVSSAATSDTTTTTTTNPDSSSTTTTSKSTSCTGGNCTTTTTTITDNGPATSTTTTTSQGDFCAENPKHIACKAQGGFCEENPDLSICKDSTFTGSCEEEPACEGDAATCAIARATWISRCAVDELKEKTAVSDLFDHENPGGSPEFEADIQKALNKDGANDFDIFAKFQEKRQDYINVTGNCPAQGLAFEFKGKTYNFNTEFVCQLGEFVRLLMHIAAYMLVARLLSRTFV